MLQKEHSPKLESRMDKIGRFFELAAITFFRRYGIGYMYSKDNGLNPDRRMTAGGRVSRAL